MVENYAPDPPTARDFGRAKEAYAKALACDDGAAASIMFIAKEITAAREEGQREPRPITQTLVEVATTTYWVESLSHNIPEIMRAVLEATEQARGSER